MSARGDARKRQQQMPPVEIDLTAAVEAAAEAYWSEYHDQADDRSWHDLTGIEKFAVRNLILPVVTAAAPAISNAERARLAAWMNGPEALEIVERSALGRTATTGARHTIARLYERLMGGGT